MKVNLNRAFYLLVLCLSLGQLTFAQTATGTTPSATQRDSVVPPATITGSGTTDYIPLWTGSTALGNSALYQTGGHVGVFTTTPNWALDVNGQVNTNKTYKIG